MSAERELALRVLGLIDLTDLDDDCTEDDVARLCSSARTPFGNVAAVCVWPRFVTSAVVQLAGSDVAVATVVNFPAGSTDVMTALSEAGAALVDGADEIDVVIPYRAFIEGDDAAVTAMVQAIDGSAAEARVKAILETGELRDQQQVARAARLAIDAGADFIKTSTGKSAVSATPEAVSTMLEVIRDDRRPVGIKPSGGIRTLDQAAVYLRLADEVMGPRWATPATFRFGASSLLGAVLDALG